MSKQIEVIKENVEFFLEEISQILSNLTNEVDSYPLKNYILKSVFLQMTGAQEQKFKSIAWEFSSDDYEFARTYKSFASEGFSRYESKKKLYKKIKSKLKINEFDVKEKIAIFNETMNVFNNYLDNSLLHKWNEKEYIEFKEYAEHFKELLDKLDNVEDLNKDETKKLKKEVDFASKNDLLSDDLVKIYEKYLYEHRNNLAHNTLSYQNNTSLLFSSENRDLSSNNYFLWFYILILIDKIMIELFNKFDESRKDLLNI